MEVQAAKISDQQLRRLREFEEELGTVLLAVESPEKYAELSDDEVAVLQKTESDLGCIVVAYSR